MACSSCGTKTEGGVPTGCGSNGTCGTSGCNALNVYDWFKDMDLPDDFDRFNIVEVRYKGSRKEYYRNTPNLELYTGDYVVTEGAFGFDIGTVSAAGEIVRLQLKKQRLTEDSDLIRNIIRKANSKELEKFEELKAKENSTLERARTIAFGLNLAMKLSDIEFQGDGRKVTFFYTAESRVDFRELIRRYADEFRVKIEMRHISYREEASRLGGIGDCGRQLCCSTWLTDYKQVNTGAARVQNLSINMEKLAGQCGRLKCCLNYELDTYLEAVDEFPKLKVVKLETVGGVAYSRKSDILKRIMWFSYEDSQSWIPLSVTQVNEILEQNKNGVQGAALTDLAPAAKVMEQIAGSQSEFISNEQLLQEDKEFEEEMRKKREKSERQNNSRGRDNNRRDNRNPNQGQGPRGPQNRNERKDGKDNRNPNQGPRNPQQNRNPEGTKPVPKGPDGRNPETRKPNPNAPNRNQGQPPKKHDNRDHRNKHDNKNNRNNRNNNQENKRPNNNPPPQA
jgi:cell fate regulator YaaT (PSP1 superfamily)